MTNTICSASKAVWKLCLGENLPWICAKLSHKGVARRPSESARVYLHMAMLCTKMVIYGLWKVYCSLKNISV